MRDDASQMRLASCESIEESPMLLCKGILRFLMLGPAFAAGCGLTVSNEVTNENVREKIITQEDLDEFNDEQTRLIELGFRNLPPPQSVTGSPSSAGP